MKEINGKIKQKNNTFLKGLKINKNLFAERISNECNFLFMTVGPSLVKNTPPGSTRLRHR